MNNRFTPEIFEVTLDINEIHTWNNPQIWKISEKELFPIWFEEVIIDVRESIEEYYRNGLKPKNSKYPNRMLRTLSRHLSNEMNIIEALMKSNGWRGKIGFGIAIYHMRKYFQENDSYPTSNTNSTFERIRRAASTNWEEFNIYSWNDLMLFVFNTRNDAKYAIDGGLEIAIEELKLKQKEIEKLPSSKDCPGIFQAVGRGVFEDDGINLWNELLFLVFEDIHVEVGKYLGVKGFELAKKEMRDYYEMHNKLPTINIPEMIGISNAISRGNFKEFNINRWNDLLRAVFGEVNVITRKYRGKKGLEIAKFELLEFYKQTGKIPSYNDNQFVSIINAANNNRWEEFGITSFNDLLMYVFGKVNRVSPNTYKGYKGLHYIQGVLIESYEEYSRLPTSSDEGMHGINGAISRGYYVEHGIKTWNDLLRVTFGELNHRQLVYNDKEGLDLARKEMKEHYDKTGELPKSKDFHGIVAALKRREWVEFGITYWNDLMQEIFGEYNYAGHRGKYHDKDGLETAFSELYVVEKREGRLPQANDKGINGIRAALKKGNFKEFEIDNWSELLFAAFGTKYKNIKLKGERGFKQAEKLLLVFEEEHSRLPGNKDKDVQAVIRAIDRREFLDFGVRVWNDMLRHVFGKVNLRSHVFTGDTGFENARNELLKLRDKLGRLPTASDEGIGGILIAIKRGQWADRGIFRWNNMLDTVFGEVNHRITNMHKQGE